MLSGSRKMVTILSNALKETFVLSFQFCQGVVVLNWFEVNLPYLLIFSKFFSNDCSRLQRVQTQDITIFESYLSSLNLKTFDPYEYFSNPRIELFSAQLFATRIFSTRHIECRSIYTKSTYTIIQPKFKHVTV